MRVIYGLKLDFRIKEDRIMNLLRVAMDDGSTDGAE